MSRRMTRREFLYATAITASSAIIAACGGPQETAPVEKPTTGPTATTVAVAPTAVPPAPTVIEAKDGGTLRCTFSSQRDDLCPMHPSGRVNIDTNRKIFSALTYLDPNFDLQGDLADRWELSDDRKTYTFHLRKGVKWHDGSPFTSKDVAFTFGRNADPDCASAFAGLCERIVGYQDVQDGKAEMLSGVQTPDDYTVTIELTGPSSAFTTSIVKIFMIPEHILGQVAPADLRKDPFWSTLPIGTGPYKLSQYVPKQTIEYTRNEDFFQGKPQIEKQIWSVIPSSETQVLALLKGDLDYVYSLPSDPETLGTISENSDLHTLQAIDPRVRVMHIHYKKIPDLKVRQAICAAINREALLAVNGGPEVAIIENYWFQNPWASEGAVKWGDVHKYDPEKAKALLQEAGWDPNRELIFQQAGTGGTEASPEMAMIQEQLAAVGIKTKIVMVETAQQLDKEDTHDLAITGQAPIDPREVALAYVCDSAVAGGAALARYCNPEFDKLMEEEELARDQEERATIYRKMQELLVNDAVGVLLPRSPNRCGLSKKVHVDRWSWYAADESWKWWMEA